MFPIKNKNILGPRKIAGSKGIEEGLSSLKSKAPKHESLQSKMPSRVPLPPKEIPLPTRKKFLK